MAIDYGDAHTGVAISDLTCQLAGYTETIHSRKREKVLERLGQLIEEYEVTELALGYPKNMDGTAGPRAEKSAAFREELAQAYGLPVTLWDERRTTIEAHSLLSSAGKNGRQRKKTVDAVAAALILEGFLTFRSGQGKTP